MTPSKESMELAKQLRAIFQTVYSYKEGREKQLEDATKAIDTAIAKARLEGAEQERKSIKAQDK